MVSRYLECFGFIKRNKCSTAQPGLTRPSPSLLLRCAILGPLVAAISDAAIVFMVPLCTSLVPALGGLVAAGAAGAARGATISDFQ
jgi:hypothetical protein